MNLLALSLALTTLTGGSQNPANQNPANSPLQGTTWTLQQIKPGPESITLGRLIEHPVLRIQGNTATGTTGCSPLRANVNISGNALRFSNIDAGTDEHCPDHPLALRDDYTRLLGNATQYRITGNTLTIQAGTQWLKFTAQKGNTMTQTLPDLNGDWQVTRLMLNGKAVPLVKNAQLTLKQQGKALQLNADLGCNQLSAGGTLSGQQVNFGGLTSTRMMCDPAQMQAEMALGQLAQDTLTIAVNGSNMTWTGKTGSVTFTRQPAVLSGTYTLVSLNGQTPPKLNRPAEMVFQGGKVSGSDGCNMYSADYQLTGQQIKLTTPAMSTLMACPDNGEVPLPALLDKQPTYTLNGNTLTLKAGTEVWVFEQK